MYISLQATKTKKKLVNPLAKNHKRNTDPANPPVFTPSRCKR